MKRYTAKLPTSKKQAGFTLIELIMVIVILGVLSAFALPRFADLGSDARIASINGLAGAIRSAANIAHAQQLADNDTSNTVELEGVSIDMVNGYPQAIAGGITTAAQVSAGTAQQLTDGAVDYQVSGGGAAGGATITYQLRANCSVAYQAANSTTAGNPPVTTFTTIGITVVTTGC